MPTILFLRSSSRLGGIERQLLWHARQLQAQGWQVTLANLHRGAGEHPLTRAAQQAGLSAITVHDPAAWRPRAGRHIRQLVQEQRPDVLHTLDYRTDALVAWLPQRPVWLAETQGHTNEGWRMGLWNWLDVRALRRADLVAPVSAAWETWLAVHGVAPRRMALLANSRAILRPAPMPAPIPLSGPGPHFLYAGRLSPEKGVDFLLRAWPRLRQQWPDAQLWLLGAAASRRYQRRIRRLGRQPGLHWLGHQDDIRAWLAAAHAVIIPSRREAWGMTAFEALCLGAPVVAARIGGLPAVTRGAAHACLFTPEDPQALATALAHVLAPDWPRGPAVARAYCAQPRFEPQHRHRRLLGLYQRLLDAA